jgi:hypothetical protein
MKIDPKSIKITKAKSYSELIEAAAAELEQHPELNKVEIAEIGQSLVRIDTPEEQAALDDELALALPVEVNGVTYLCVAD